MHVSAMMKYHGVFCQHPASGGGVDASVEDLGGRGNEVPTLNLATCRNGGPGHALGLPVRALTRK